MFIPFSFCNCDIAYPKSFPPIAIKFLLLLADCDISFPVDIAEPFRSMIVISSRLLIDPLRRYHISQNPLPISHITTSSTDCDIASLSSTLPILIYVPLSIAISLLLANCNIYFVVDCDSPSPFDCDSAIEHRTIISSSSPNSFPTCNCNMREPSWMQYFIWCIL